MQLLPSLVIWATPIAHLSVAILVFHFALHCPGRRSRLLLFLLFLYFAVLSFLASTNFPFGFLASLWAQSMALNIVHVFSVLFIENKQAPYKGKKDLLSTANICSTYRLWANPQLLPEVKAKPSRSDQQVTRAVFLLLRLAKLGMYYCMYTLVLPIFYDETLGRILPSDVAQPALLARSAWGITPRETVMRSYVAISWVWNSLVFLDGANAALALFFVGIGFDQPDDWPQLFGSLSEARGLRNFWGRFWHKLAMRPYRNCGLVISRTLVRLPCGKLLGRQMSDAVVAFVVFLLSGLSHAAVSWRLGVHDLLDVKWFLLNFAACFIEKLVLSLMRHIAARRGLEREWKMIERSWLGTLVAYGWVFGFFFWSVPLWVYPRYQRVFEQAEKRARM